MMAWPLVGLRRTYTFVYVLSNFAYPLASPWSAICRVVQYVTWAAFVVDYLVQLVSAHHTRTFPPSEWMALFLVGVPFLRPVRAIRDINFLRQGVTRPRQATLVSIPWSIATMGALMKRIMTAAVLKVERFAH
jgi:voltage-gated potassium channel